MDQRFLALTRGAYQSREELAWLWREHLVPLRPRHIIEIGVASGGTTRLFLDLVGRDGLVVGIDLDEQQIAPDVRRHDRLRLIVGSSSNPGVVAQVRSLMPACDLLLIDGDHSEAGVLADTHAYLPLVRAGGLVLWHDVQLESPSGIKRVWYRVLRPRLPGAIEHFADPFNTGFGIWYKRDEVRGEVGGDDRSAEVPFPASHGPEATPARLAAKARRLVGDTSALRDEVATAVLDALTANREPEFGAERRGLIAESGPAVARSFVRLQQWRGLVDFVDSMVERAPSFAPAGVVALAEGLFRARLLRTDDVEFAERCSETALQCLALEDLDDEIDADACARLMASLRASFRPDLSLRVGEAAIERGRSHTRLRMELVATHLELAFADRGFEAAHEGHLQSAQRLLRVLLDEHPDSAEIAHLAVATGAGDVGALAAARDFLERQLQRARASQTPSAVSTEQDLAVPFAEFGFAIVRAAFLPTEVGQLREDLSASSVDRADVLGRIARTLGDAGANSATAALIKTSLGEWFLDTNSEPAVLNSGKGELRQDANVRPADRRTLAVWLCLAPSDDLACNVRIIAHRIEGLFPSVRDGSQPARLIPAAILPETVWSPTLAPGDLLLWTSTTAHALPASEDCACGLELRLMSRRHGG